MFSQATCLIILAAYATATPGVAADRKNQNQPWDMFKPSPGRYKDGARPGTFNGHAKDWDRPRKRWGFWKSDDDSNISPMGQNGWSTWGSFNQSALPQWSSWNGYGKPWGGMTTNNANPYTSSGKVNGPRVRTYDFTVASCDIKPDGVLTKGAVCINGQFPGPLIEANYGDTIQVKVTNGLKDEGTSMHWHGFLQTSNCQNDGVPGVQQCPIAPGQSYTYTMKAELYGSSWYHTHYSAQYAGGAVGPMVVYGPWNSAYDIDVGPVMLSEWYRDSPWTTIQKLFRPLKAGGPVKPLANSNLIDGKMRFPCGKTNLPCVTAAYAKFNFTSGKNHKLRLMNVGSAAVQKFSIDGHTMQVIATDYMPVKPYNTSMVALGVGQRADVVVFGSGKKGEKYWMRSNIGGGCSLNDGVMTEARAAIYYQGADTKTLPTAAANQGPAAGSDQRVCLGDPLSVTEPSYPLKAANPDATREFEIRTKSNGTNIIYTFGQRTFRANFNEPLLRKALDNEIIEVDPTRNLWYLKDAKVARAIIYNYNDAPHPIHYHGHNMQILNMGFGKWDGSIVRPNNPQRRDVQMMPPGTETTPSFLVIQWDVDNPGIWPLHCHFAWHSSMGLVANIVEPSVVGIQKSLKSASSQIKGTCDGWNAWLKKTGGPLLTGIDSGLKKA